MEEEIEITRALDNYCSLCNCEDEEVVICKWCYECAIEETREQTKKEIMNNVASIIDEVLKEYPWAQHTLHERLEIP